MKKEYEIKLVPETGKYVIIYYIDGKQEIKEHYAYSDGVPVVDIRYGYVLKTE